MHANLRQHQPPTRRAGKGFLVIVAVQLVAAGVGLAVLWHAQSVYSDILDRQESLVLNRHQVDQLAEQINRAVQRPTVEQRQQGAGLLHELDATPTVQSLLANTTADLPVETAEVQQALAELHRCASSSPQSPRTSAEQSAIAHLQRAMGSLRIGVNRLDEANFSRINQLHVVREWRLIWVLHTFLLMLLTALYAYWIHRRTRQDELERFHIESELAAERLALEGHVQERTRELENEAKERRRSERLNRGCNRVLEMLAHNESSADMLKVLAETVSGFRSTWLCAVHVLDGKQLKLTASSGITEKLAQHLRAISVDFPDAAESSALAAGRLWAIEDLSQRHKPWCELLRANGILSVWSAPFLAPDSTPLGTLTVYTLLPDRPTTAGIEMLEMSCQMAALVLERRRMQSRLIEHAYHDSLTGLPNRRLGEDRLSNATARSLRSKNKTAILWFDLNKFKQINDMHGHPIGDAVLQQAASRLSGRLRASDTLARMGGDEFMAILEEIHDRESAETIAIDLLDVLALPMYIGGKEIVTSASIGISLFPDDGDSVDSLAQHADRAMYAAKFANCGVLSYTPDMDREPTERRELEAELSLALENNGFSLDYQPQCLPDGTLVGFEALLRFHSERLGDMSPAQFIPIAEESGLIVPIGEWVLREVCRQSKEWQADGHKMVTIAINISAIQFDREDFADTVARILTETDQTPNLIELELTESIVMQDITETTRQMNRLKQLGVRIAIDDFGTGYSSLSYLHRLPIDVLKIDRSFVENLDEPEGTRPIVEAVLSMAHALGYRVIAEGVETEGQLASLQKKNCDMIQGFLFSRPLKPIAAAAILQAGKLERKLFIPQKSPLLSRQKSETASTSSNSLN